MTSEFWRKESLTLALCSHRRSHEASASTTPEEDTGGHGFGWCCCNLGDAAHQSTWSYSSTIISYAGHRRVVQRVEVPILLAKHTTEEAQENSGSLGLVFFAKSQLIAWCLEQRIRVVVFYTSPEIPL